MKEVKENNQCHTKYGHEDDVERSQLIIKAHSEGIENMFRQDEIQDNCNSNLNLEEKKEVIIMASGQVSYLACKNIVSIISLFLLLSIYLGSLINAGSKEQLHLLYDNFQPKKNYFRINVIFFVILWTAVTGCLFFLFIRLLFNCCINSDKDYSGTYEKVVAIKLSHKFYLANFLQTLLILVWLFKDGHISIIGLSLMSSILYYMSYLAMTTTELKDSFNRFVFQLCLGIVYSWSICLTFNSIVFQFKVRKDKGLETDSEESIVPELIAQCFLLTAIVLILNYFKRIAPALIVFVFQLGISVHKIRQRNSHLRLNIVFTVINALSILIFIFFDSKNTSAITEVEQLQIVYNSEKEHNSF